MQRANISWRFDAVFQLSKRPLEKAAFIAKSARSTRVFDE
jgi:hypothetical protein